MEIKKKLEVIDKELRKLEDKNINLLDLMVYDEIINQLDEEISDDDFIKLFNKSKNTYLNGENESLYNIVNYCKHRLNILDDLSTYTILMNCDEV